MMKLKDILRDHKFSYNMVKNPDSIHQRSSAARAGTIEPGDGPYGGRDIMKILGIEDEGPQHHPGNKYPMRLMDLVMDTWAEDETYEDEPEDVDDED